MACNRNRSPSAMVIVGWVSSNGRDGWLFWPRKRMASTSSSSLSATGGIVRRRPSPYCTTTESQPWISMFSTAGSCSNGWSRPYPKTASSTAWTYASSLPVDQRSAPSWCKERT